MIWVLAITLLCFLPYLCVRVWNRNRYVQERTEKQDARVLALDDWLRTPEIRETAIRNHVANEAGLERLRKNVGAMQPGEVKAYTAAFLDNRHVRMAVAKHLEGRGVPRAEAMRELLKLTGKEA